MPKGDGTGPDGQGPKTGRGLGDCGGQTQQSDYKPGFYFGGQEQQGQGRGQKGQRGRFRRWFSRGNR